MKGYWKEFSDENEAAKAMRIYNRTLRGSVKNRLRVLVDGPTDNWVVMDLATAIDNGFFYSWEV